MNQYGVDVSVIENIITNICSYGEQMTTDRAGAYEKYVLENMLLGWRSNPGNRGATSVLEDLNDMFETISRELTSLCNTVKETANISIQSIEQAEYAGATGSGVRVTADTEVSWKKVEVDDGLFWKQGDPIIIIPEIIDDIKTFLNRNQNDVETRLEKIEAEIKKLPSAGLLTTNSEVIDKVNGIYTRLYKGVMDSFGSVNAVVFSICDTGRRGYDEAIKNGKAELDKLLEKGDWHPVYNTNFF